MIKLFLVLSVLFLYSSCNPHKKKAITEIDSLIQKTDSIEEVFNNINWIEYKNIHDSVQPVIEHTNTLLDEILRQYPDFLNIYVPYSEAYKIMGRAYSKKHEKISKQIQLTKQQLSTLRSDVISNTIKYKKLSETILEEQKDIEMLGKSVTDIQELLEMEKRAFKTLQPKVDSILFLFTKHK